MVLRARGKGQGAKINTKRKIKKQKTFTIGKIPIVSTCSLS